MRWAFATILLAAILARLVALGSNPAGVFHDEAEKGYSAWSLGAVGGVFDFTARPDSAPGIATFRVPMLKRHPLFLNVWGSRTSAIYQYAALPCVALAGPSARSIRTPAALAGALTVLFTFLLARALSARRSVALAAMAFLALSPWHLVFSRWALQGIFVPLFIAAGAWAFARALEAQRPDRQRAWGFATGALFGLAFYAYSGARPFLLAFWPMLAFVWRREANARRDAMLAALVALALFVAPTLAAMLGGGGAGMGRFRHLSVFGLDAPLHVQLLVALKNYLTHFSPQFLFLTGDANPRHSVGGFGQLLHVEAFCLVVGTVVAARRRATADRFLLGWFLLFPLSAALTAEGIPHALRTLHALPCPQILAAIGAIRCLDWLRAKWGAWAARSAIALGGLNAAVFLFVLFTRYPVESAPSFEYAIARATEAVRQDAQTQTGASQDAQPRLYVVAGADMPFVYELYLFHLRTPPSRLRWGGMEACPVRPVAPSETPERALDRLRPGESLLVGAVDYRLRYDAAAHRPGLRVRPFAAWPESGGNAPPPLGCVLLTSECPE